MFTKITAMLAVVLVASCSAKENPEQKEDKPVYELSTPSGLRLLESGSASLSFAWDAVDGAARYAAALYDENGTRVPKTGLQYVTEPSAVFTGLAESTVYVFKVKAQNGKKESAESEGLSAKTGSSSPGPLDPPDPPKKYDSPADAYADMLIPEHEEGGGVRAFPGAEGGGMSASGGRGGSVIHVTNLNDGGEGSLRAALSASGARTVVFDVAGTIALQSSLVVKNGNVTVAGQTAPGDGICIRNYNVRVAADNVILRFLRFRMGDEKQTEDDALQSYTGSDPGHRNIIIDHCSVSWSTDECASFYGVEDFTLQYCIISESLRNSVHGKGKHGYGGLWGGRNASFHHNLLAHHDSRNPRFDHEYLSPMKGPVHFYNNVVYNWGSNSAYGGESGPGQSPRQINMLNNYFKPGPASSNRSRIVNPTTKCSNCNKSDQYAVVPGKFHVDGNYMDDSSEVTADNWLGVHPDDKALLENVKSASYFGTRPSMVQSAAQAYSSVLGYAGASLRRDRIDRRIADETKNGTFTYTGSNGSTKGLIDSQKDVGGWPSYSATDEEKAYAVDTDRDGMPDWFELMVGLDRDSASDAHSFDIDGSRRYDNLEMYLHYLVREVISSELK